MATSSEPIKVARCFPAGESSHARRTHAVRDDERTFCGRQILGWEYGEFAEVDCLLCGIVIRQDAAVFELLAKWNRAPTSTESAKPGVDDGD